MRIAIADVLLDDKKVPVLVRRKTVNYPLIQHMDKPETVVQVVNDVFHADKQIAEVLCLVAMDKKNKPVAFFVVNRGTVNSSLVDVRGIMIRLLLANAATFIIIHNHVSGETQPSEADITITKRIKSAADIIGIELCDHIIIGSEGRFYSFRESIQDMF